MKKNTKIIIILSAALLVIALAAYPIPRYGWKLFGFSLCDSPSSVMVFDVDVSSDSVRLKGGTTSSATAFVGYVYKIKDNTLYIGMKYNLLLGFTDRIGDFDIQIPIGSDSFEKIVIKGGSSEEVIFEK